MTAPDLPAELKAALDARLHGLSRNDAAERAALISQTYRDGGGSGAIRSETDALAYALARMPATYAAVTASLNALREITPGFRAGKPARCRRRAGNGDLGRGGSVFLAAELHAAGCQHRLARAGAGSRPRQPAPARRWHYRRGEARAALADAEAADLVVASYMIGEIDDAERSALAELMWAKTRDTLLIVEPGTPAGYARIIALRRATDRVGRACRSPLPARRRMSARSARLVSLHPTPAALARAQAAQGRRTSLRGRKIQLCRADARAGCAASRPRAGAA